MSPEIFSFSHTKSIPNLDGLQSLSSPPSIHEVIQSWRSVALADTLLLLSGENGYYTDVLGIFEFPRTNCPEVLVLSLASASVESDLRLELLSSLITMFMITSHPNSSAVLQRLWQLNKLLVVDNMVRLYSRDSTQLSRILDIAQQDLRDLKTVLSVVPYHVFTMDLAALAARREHLFLDKWIQDMVQEHSDIFVRSILQYVKRRMFSEQGELQQGPSVETIHMFLRAIQNNAPILSPPAQEELKELLPALQPHMHQFGQSGANGNNRAGGPPQGGINIGSSGQIPAPTPASELFPPDIEHAANTYFQEIYEEKMSIDMLVQVLMEFRVSRNPREQKTYACMIHNVFDEYRFFPQYPDKELLITGALFGALIQHRLLASLPLGIALRYVLDSLKKPLGSKMFKFGIYALEQFRGRLSEWPQYCAHLVQIPQMHQVYPDWMKSLQNFLTQASIQGFPTSDADDSYDENMYMMQPSDASSQIVHDAIKKEQAQLAQQQQQIQAAATAAGVYSPPPQASQPQPPSAAQTTQSAINNSNAASAAATAAAAAASAPEEPAVNTGAVLPINTLLRGMKPIEQPEEETRDRIHFILNNLSANNMEQKSVDLLKVLKPPHYDYLAHYLVSRRVSTESNFHKLYLAFLEQLKDSDLIRKVVEQSYVAIRSLLVSPKIKQSIAERSLLKNLGLWIGMLTIARNLPILHKELALKELILSSYEKGNLIAIVPFVSKILASVPASKVFKTPNPWTVALLRLFVELYHVTDIRTTIQFEIELLFRALDVDMSSIQPSDLLRSRRPYTGPDVTDFTNPPKLPEEPPQPPPGSLGLAPTQADLNVTPWLQYITISPKLQLFAQHPELKRLCYVAINRAIEEIIEPVVDRVVTIASTTTQKLTSKDFAMEPDENKLVHAAHCMVQSLAGSLSNVICKEPLRVSILNHLRLALKDVTLNIDQALLDYSFQTVVTENLDLACLVIERVSTERAILEVNEQLASAVEARKTHREQQRLTGSTQPYYDISYFGGRFPALPEVLRSHFGGVLPHQMAVYEEFLARGTPAATAAMAGFPPQVAQQPLGAPSMPFGAATLAAETAPLHANKADNHLPPISRTTATGVPVMGSGGVNINSLQGGVLGGPAVDGPAEGVSTQPLRVAETQQTSPRRTTVAAAASASAPQPETLSQEPVDTSTAIDAALGYLAELEQLATANLRHSFSFLPPDHKAHQLIARIENSIARADDSTEAATALTQRTLRQLWENARGDGEPNLLREVYFHALVAVSKSSAKVKKDITSWSLYGEDEKRYNRSIVSGFLRHQLLKALDLDVQLAKQLDKGRNKVAVEFALFLIRKCLLEEHIINSSGLVSTFEELEKVVQRGRERNAPEAEALHALLQQARSVSTDDEPNKAGGAAAPVASSVPSHASLAQKVTVLFNEWVGLNSQHSPPSESAQAQFIQQLQQLGLYGSQDGQNETELGFYRGCCEAAVNAYHAKLAQQQKDTEVQEGDEAELVRESYLPVDAFAKLVVLLVKYYPEKTQLLSRVLGQLAVVMNADFTRSPADFNQRPYFRLLADLLANFSAPDPAFDQHLFGFLLQFSELFHIFQPKKYPGFAFAWLELISHRTFMPKLLRDQRGWPIVQQLLVELLEFLEPFLRKAKMPPEIRMFYKGTLRVLLVLLHDFPEFLSDYHFSFCDVLPVTCVQLRNLMLSAFPRSMKLPDPFTPNLKVDLLPEIKESPRILSNFTKAIAEAGIKNELEAFLKAPRENAQFLLTLGDKFQLAPQEAAIRGTRYNVSLINAVVLYCGACAIQDPTLSSAMDFFRYWASSFDMEGRYLFFNAIANQLRYPNTHTYYFSCVILLLFQEAQSELIQEQITRVLLERLIAHRPHPWGLLITFIELIKNPRYNFWDRAFTRCSPEIERLFISVARSCMPQATAQ
jgi:CCR4-NOT transcription complex subunit 1